MSRDPVQPHRTRKKCASCGLVNSPSDEVCRRCGESLFDGEDFDEPAPVSLSEPASVKKRSFLSRLIWILTTTTILLLLWYVSLLITSDDLQPDQREKVQAAIIQLQQHGFDREGFVLQRLTVFRSSDNWWNRVIGHRDAYAATNFPFEIVTLYPEFFNVPVDDTERAAVLLHEARHLLGDGEEGALRSAWQRKRALGWTEDRYRQTRVWDATQRLTKEHFPYMFQCGEDARSDCY